MFLFWFYLSSKTGKTFNSIFFESLILVQMVLYFSNSFSLSIWKEINLLLLSFTLNVLTYPLILGNSKTNGLTTLSKYTIKYLEFVFVSTNFEITILSNLTSQIIIVFLHYNTFLLLLLSRQISALYTTKGNLSLFFS